MLVQFGPNLYFFYHSTLFSFSFSFVLLLEFALHGAGGAYCLGFALSSGNIHSGWGGRRIWDLWADCTGLIAFSIDGKRSKDGRR